MIKINRRGRRIAAVAVAAGAVAVAGTLAGTSMGGRVLADAAQGGSGHGTISGSGSGTAVLTNSVKTRKVTDWVPLTPMPQGTVTLGRDWFGTVDATVDAFGLTPGSSHTVELVNRYGQEVASFGTLTANGAGQAFATLDSNDRHPLGGSHVVILNGTAGGPVSAEPIARTTQHVDDLRTYRLIPVEVSAYGAGHGTPQGAATVTYNPHAQTIAVTVNASGLTPGAHAAHIHVGSCAAQGPVQYMLMDFTADAHGRIANETRTVTGVTTPLPATGWYLNLHQGNSNNILTAAGNPTINFRPLLCGDIVTHG
jgi:CHRD domain